MTTLKTDVYQTSPGGVCRLRQYDKVSSTAGEVQIKMMGHLTITRSRNIRVEVLREMSVLFFKPNLTFLLANKIKEIFIKPT